MKDYKYNAFSYIEVTFVLAIFALSSFLLVPLSLSQLSSSRLSYYASDINSYIFSCQQDSYTQMDGSGHGLRFNEDSYDVFTGNSYSTSINSFNVVLNNNIEIIEVDLIDNATSNPTDELVFSRGSFKPNSHGTITLSDGSLSYQVIINLEGLAYYEKL